MVFFICSKAVSNTFVLLLLVLIPFILSLFFPIFRIQSMNRYYADQALQTGNESYCRKVAVNQSTCYTNVALQKNDANICEDIQSSSSWNDIRYKCIAAIAIRNKNTDMCMTIPVPTDSNGRINNTNVRGQCLDSINLNKMGDSSISTTVGSIYIKSIMPSSVLPADGKTRAVIYGAGFSSSTPVFIQNFQNGPRVQLKVSINNAGDQIVFSIPVGTAIGNYKLFIPGDDGKMLQETLYVVKE